MIKIIAIALALLSSGLLMIPLSNENVLSNILIFMGLFIGFILIDVILFFLIAAIISIPVKDKEEPKKYNHFLRKVYGTYVDLASSLFGVRLHVYGTDKIPKDGTFLATSNHLSNVDPFVFDKVLRDKKLIFISKESLFHIPFFGRIIRGAGFMKLYRTSNQKDDLKELLRGIKWLKEEQCSIAVYPEGTRNKNYPEPVMGEFHPGTYSLAVKSKKPILICSIIGTEKINDKLLFKTHDIYFNIVKCLTYDEYKDMSTQEIADLSRKLTIEGIQNIPEKEDYIKLY